MPRNHPQRRRPRAQPRVPVRYCTTCGMDVRGYNGVMGYCRPCETHAIFTGQPCICAAAIVATVVGIVNCVCGATVDDICIDWRNVTGLDFM